MYWCTGFCAGCCALAAANANAINAATTDADSNTVHAAYKILVQVLEMQIQVL